MLLAFPFHEGTLQQGTSAGSSAHNVLERHGSSHALPLKPCRLALCRAPHNSRLNAARMAALADGCLGCWVLPAVSSPKHLGQSLTARCGMQGTLPSEWGLNGMFPQLNSLSVSYNPPLSGLLPATWGSDNSSFQSLQLFEANNCNLTGGLRAQWATQLPSLADINISSNALTGFFCSLHCLSHILQRFVGCPARMTRRLLRGQVCTSCCFGHSAFLTDCLAG